MYLISSITTVVIFGFIGYMFSNRIHLKINYPLLALLFFLTVLLFYVGVNTRLISVFKIEIMLNQVLGSFAGGITIGLLIIMGKNKR